MLRILIVVLHILVVVTYFSRVTYFTSCVTYFSSSVTYFTRCVTHFCSSIVVINSISFPQRLPESVIQGIFCPDDPNVYCPRFPDSVWGQEVVDFVDSLGKLFQEVVNVIQQSKRHILKLWNKELKLNNDNNNKLIKRGGRRGV